jgi:hypothetical protein
MTRPITSFPFDLTRPTLPEWLSKPLPSAKPMTGPTFVKNLTSAKISDIGSDRQADEFPEKRPPDFPPKRFNGRNKRKGQSPPISRKEFIPNFERPNTRSQARQSTNFIPMEPTQAEKDFINKRAELQEKEKEFQRKQAELCRQDSDLQRQKEELENQRKKKVAFEEDRMRKLELENARMKGQLSDLQDQNRESSADLLAPNTEPRSEPSSEPFTYPQTLGQARQSQQDSHT